MMYLGFLAFIVGGLLFLSTFVKSLSFFGPQSAIHGTNNSKGPTTSRWQCLGLSVKGKSIEYVNLQTAPSAASLKL